MMKPNDLPFPLTAEALIAFVQGRQHVSFAEIMRAFEGARGDRYLEIGDRNIVLWPGVSVALAELLNSPTVLDAIEMKPCPFLVYLIDGEMPTLPIAKRGRYKKPHWLPVTFSSRTKKGR